MANLKKKVSSVTAESRYQEITPIEHAIVPDRQGKKRWYGTHQFYTRRAWNVVQEYIKNFAPVKGAVVLDPFGGSGVTAVEAAILGRTGVTFDINPFAVFYAKCSGIFYANPLDATKSELIPKFNNVIAKFQKLYPTGSYSEAKWQQLARQYKIPTNNILDHRVKCKTFDLHTGKQLHDLALLKDCILSEKYANDDTKQLLLFVFSATASKCNKTFVSAKGRKASRGGARMFSSYALNLPPNPVELPVFPEFQNKFKKMLNAKRELFLEISEHSAFNFSMKNRAAQEIDKELEPETVDYIFTDPPYGKLIPYMDLSSFFCDWLDLKITDSMRKKDIIENSSMHREKSFYYDEMQKSFNKMFEVLKYDRWMTLVYAHKDTEYWDAIIAAAQNAGFEFINAVYEKPDVIWSLTKKKNKATTFSGELYLNFKKIRSARGKLISVLKEDFHDIIRNTVELAIVHNGGCATLEDVYSELVPILSRNGIAGRFRQEKIDIKDYLEQDFVYNDRLKGYELPAQRKLSSFIPIEDRVLFYVRDFLISRMRLGAPVSLDDIISNVLPMLVNGLIPSRESILDVLGRIASKDVAGMWSLAEDDEDDVASDLPIPISSCIHQKIPDTTPHNKCIWKLLYIGNKASCSTTLGKNEQKDELLKTSGMPYLQDLPFKVPKNQGSKIEQIDVIWTKNARPEYAFEVEESTQITSAFERFSKLMEAFPQAAEHQRFVVIVPRRRLKKLKDVFSNSTYIGKPLYFENKVRILCTEDVDQMFESCKDTYFRFSDLEKYLKRFDEIERQPGSWGKAPTIAKKVSLLREVIEVKKSSRKSLKKAKQGSQSKSTKTR